MDLINGGISPDNSMFTSSSMYTGNTSPPGFMENGAVSPSYNGSVDVNGGLDSEGYQPPTYAEAFPPLPSSNSPDLPQAEANKPWRGKSTTVTQVRVVFSTSTGWNIIHDHYKISQLRIDCHNIDYQHF